MANLFIFSSSIPLPALRDFPPSNACQTTVKRHPSRSGEDSAGMPGMEGSGGVGGDAGFRGDFEFGVDPAGKRQVSMLEDSVDKIW